MGIWCLQGVFANNSSCCKRNVSVPGHWLQFDMLKICPQRGQQLRHVKTDCQNVVLPISSRLLIRSTTMIEARNCDDVMQPAGKFGLGEVWGENDVLPFLGILQQWQWHSANEDACQHSHHSECHFSTATLGCSVSQMNQLQCWLGSWWSSLV